MSDKIQTLFEMLDDFATQLSEQMIELGLSFDDDSANGLVREITLSDDWPAEWVAMVRYAIECADEAREQWEDDEEEE